MLKNLLAVMAIIVSILVLAWPPTYAEDSSEDSVFLQEEDSDFADPTEDNVPPLVETNPPPKVAEPAVIAQPEVDPAPAAPAPAPKKAKSVTKKEKPAPAPKVAKVPGKKKASGYFSVVKTECPMHREPASESPELTKVKAEKKIWVEEHDTGWVRGFRRSGDVGYLSKTCFQ